MTRLLATLAVLACFHQTRSQPLMGEDMNSATNEIPNDETIDDQDAFMNYPFNICLLKPKPNKKFVTLEDCFANPNTCTSPRKLVLNETFASECYSVFSGEIVAANPGFEDAIQVLVNATVLGDQAIVTYSDFQDTSSEIIDALVDMSGILNKVGRADIDSVSVDIVQNSAYLTTGGDTIVGSNSVFSVIDGKRDLEHISSPSIVMIRGDNTLMTTYNLEINQQGNTSTFAILGGSTNIAQTGTSNSLSRMERPVTFIVGAGTKTRLT
eukprot:CFRG2669T1